MAPSKQRNDRTIGVSLPHDLADLVKETAGSDNLTISAYVRNLIAADLVKRHTGHYMLAVRTGRNHRQYWTLPTGDPEENPLRVDRQSYEHFLAGRPFTLPHLWHRDPEADFKQELPPERGDDPTGYWTFVDPADEDKG